MWKKHNINVNAKINVSQPKQNITCKCKMNVKYMSTQMEMQKIHAKQMWNEHTKNVHAKACENTNKTNYNTIVNVRIHAQQTTI